MRDYYENINWKTFDIACKKLFFFIHEYIFHIVQSTIPSPSYFIYVYIDMYMEKKSYTRKKSTMENEWTFFTKSCAVNKVLSLINDTHAKKNLPKD